MTDLEKLRTEQKAAAEEMQIAARERARKAVEIMAQPDAEYGIADFIFAASDGMPERYEAEARLLKKVDALHPGSVVGVIRGDQIEEIGVTASNPLRLTVEMSDSRLSDGSDYRILRASLGFTAVAAFKTSASGYPGHSKLYTKEAETTLLESVSATPGYLIDFNTFRYNPHAFDAPTETQLIVGATQLQQYIASRNTEKTPMYRDGDPGERFGQVINHLAQLAVDLPHPQDIVT